MNWLPFECCFAFVVSLVTFDRFVREHISFLKTPPKIRDGQTLASWNRLMTFGETLTENTETPPQLLSDYLKLIDSTERQRTPFRSLQILPKLLHERDQVGA